MTEKDTSSSLRRKLLRLGGGFPLSFVETEEKDDLKMEWSPQNANDTTLWGRLENHSIGQAKLAAYQRQWLMELLNYTEPECMSILYAKSLLDPAEQSSQSTYGKNCINVKMSESTKSSSHFPPPPAKPQRCIARMTSSEKNQIMTASTPANGFKNYFAASVRNISHEYLPSASPSLSPSAPRRMYEEEFENTDETCKSLNESNITYPAISVSKQVAPNQHVRMLASSFTDVAENSRPSTSENGSSASSKAASSPSSHTQRRMVQSDCPSAFCSSSIPSPSSNCLQSTMLDHYSKLPNIEKPEQTTLRENIRYRNVITQARPPRYFSSSRTNLSTANISSISDDCSMRNSDALSCNILCAECGKKSVAQVSYANGSSHNDSSLSVLVSASFEGSHSSIPYPSNQLRIIQKGDRTVSQVMLNELLPTATEVRALERADPVTILRRGPTPHEVVASTSVACTSPKSGDSASDSSIDSGQESGELSSQNHSSKDLSESGSSFKSYSQRNLPSYARMASKCPT